MEIDCKETASVLAPATDVGGKSNLNSFAKLWWRGERLHDVAPQ